MQITDEFTLDLPPQQTYDLLLDLERVTPCMPGASLGEELSDGSRAVTVKVKLGPMRFVYGGTVRIAEQDAQARRAVLKGSAAAAITMRVHEADSGSRVTAVADVDLTGRAAQMGHSVVESVTKQLIGQMTTCLSERFVVADVSQQQQQPSGRAAPRAMPAPSPTAAISDRAAVGKPAPRDSQPLRVGALVWAVLRERIAALVSRLKRSAA